MHATNHSQLFLRAPFIKRSSSCDAHEVHGWGGARSVGDNFARWCSGQQSRTSSKIPTLKLFSGSSWWRVPQSDLNASPQVAWKGMEGEREGGGGRKSAWEKERERRKQPLDLPPLLRLPSVSSLSDGSSMAVCALAGGCFTDYVAVAISGLSLLL